MSEPILYVTLYVNLRKKMFKDGRRKNSLEGKAGEFEVIQLSGNSQENSGYIHLGSTGLKVTGKEMITKAEGACGPT